MSESDLHLKQDELVRSLQSSKPKQILQSLAFLSSLSTQSLTKTYSTTADFTKRSKPDKSEIEASLLPLKQSLIDTTDKLVSLQTALSNFPKKEYSTTEAKCRALRSARAEALDRLDEIISSAESEQVHEDCDDDIAAARELIVFALKESNLT